MNELRTEWDKPYFELMAQVHARRPHGTSYKMTEQEKFEPIPFIRCAQDMAWFAFYGLNDRCLTRYLMMLYTIIPRDMTLAEKLDLDYTILCNNDEIETFHQELKHHLRHHSDKFKGWVKHIKNVLKTLRNQFYRKNSLLHNFALHEPLNDEESEESDSEDFPNVSVEPLFGLIDPDQVDLGPNKQKLRELSQNEENFKVQHLSQGNHVKSKEGVSEVRLLYHL